MINVFKSWYNRYFSDPEAIILLLTIISILLIIILFGAMFAPLLASVVIAYLLGGFVKGLQRWKCPHLLAVSVVFTVFFGLVLVALIWLVPLLGQQMTNLFNELPTMIGRVQSLLAGLPSRYPRLISPTQINSMMDYVKPELANMGKHILSYSLASIPGIIEIIVYVVLVPLLVFFFLKDSTLIINWLANFVPKRRRILRQVWEEVYEQIGNYVQGRIIEMVIVGLITAVAFKLLGLQYAILMGVLVGVAALIPYIGAVVSTIPIVIIALVQWGWSAHFAYLIIVYTIISLLDSNVLVPLLFSETMNLHPVAIIVAIIFFGGLWGFWGVFFAIPLATVVRAVLIAWPKKKVPIQ